MPTAEFFQRLGLLTVREFLPRDRCLALQSHIQTGKASSATVLGHGHGNQINLAMRRTQYATVPSPIEATVKDDLLPLKPLLEQHFQVTLTALEPLQFLRYRPGDFYQPHVDCSPTPNLPAFARSRQVSIVIFLNSEVPTPQTKNYGGGALTFYGLIDDLPWRNKGFDLTGEMGLLVAFPSHLVHEVQPVQFGERYTIVTWFS